ncbi:ER degradation-enhancing alpha-mannosidase-like protein 3 [Armadillidium nasatum]|uniref:alpha-1,2-Mannosidase n=1 Tax=Armadillidium nasatum TaxID=96803 RepID=A0A5N5SW86_9CRUS|nr:ER degradation-enhancing alpha-mannosidase-like protein 3 [Armadillidium nasatum]
MGSIIRRTPFNIFIVCLFTSLVHSLEKSETENISDTLEKNESDTFTKTMSTSTKKYLKEEAKEMFYHAYNSYMFNAFPADELMPLSCKGRWRETEIPRGDIDEALGNFSLTLVDALDTLVIIGDLEEFERAVKLIIKEVTFDHDIVVSLFETNIRMVGGLISGHILAEHINQLYGAVSWYRGELLSMAQDLATRLLPAFNTSTGIPHPKVNLKYGMKSPKLQNSRDTCTACAGTIILEFASLSRLTGESIFEEKARQAMDYLWSQRHRGSDLMGTVLNVHSGDWVRRDSGVGAGIDSYYEYLLKAYVLLGDDEYLGRFNKHYSAVMKYVSQGPMMLDVHMHRPHTTSRNFMDALHAFWPGLQVLKGDIKPAIETHEMLYQVMQRHNFLPEAFTTDFQVHWGQHPLRPEFVESTYLLYEATSDPYYLNVGKQILKSLQNHAWVPCGYAAVKDVRTGVLEDRMDSFVLSETFKYLYLLFAEPEDLVINLNEFIFTTEAHLLPLSLARLSNLTTVPLSESMTETLDDDDVEYARSCPNVHFLFPGRKKFAETIRKPLKNFVNNICPSRKTIKRKLRASEFQAGNAGHMSILKDMGITLMALPDGRVQLLHTTSSSKSSDDAEEGLLFMQEMIELSKLQQDQPENPPRSVSFLTPMKKNASSDDEQKSFEERKSVTLLAGPAQFGKDLSKDIVVTGTVVKASPIKACGKLENGEEVKGKIVILERGECMFIEKARNIEALGAVGGIVVDNTPLSSSSTSPMFAMSGDGNDNVSIPMVFLYSVDALTLFEALEDDPELIVALADYSEGKLVESTIETTKEQDKQSDVVIQATGPRVKSTILKHQTTTDSIEEMKISMKSAFRSLEEAETPEEVLKAALAFVTAAQRQNTAEGSAKRSSEIISELQILLLKKTASNPGLLKSLLSVHLIDFVLPTAGTQSGSDAAKKSPDGVKENVDLFSQVLKEKISKLKDQLNSDQNSFQQVFQKIINELAYSRDNNNNKDNNKDSPLKSYFDIFYKEK